MSHFSTLRTRFTDSEILKNALQELGFLVKTNAPIRGYGIQQIQADIVAVLEGDSDLGWVRNPDGSLSLVADLWSLAKNHSLPELINSINQKYAVNQTLAQARQPGLQNANVKVVLQ